MNVYRRQKWTSIHACKFRRFGTVGLPYSIPPFISICFSFLCLVSTPPGPSPPSLPCLSFSLLPGWACWRRQPWHGCHAENQWVAANRYSRAWHLLSLRPPGRKQTVPPALNHDSLQAGPNRFNPLTHQEHCRDLIKKQFGKYSTVSNLRHPSFFQQNKILNWFFLFCLLPFYFTFYFICAWDACQSCTLDSGGSVDFSRILKRRLYCLVV